MLFSLNSGLIILVKTTKPAKKMKSQDYLHITNCLNRVKERYKLSAKELKQIDRIEQSSVTSIAFTESGGFDKRNGDFHEETREINYKIRIKYRKSKLAKEKMLILMPVREMEDHINS